MTWGSEFEFSTDHAMALRRICNNPDFLEDMGTVADGHKLLVIESEENEIAFQQTRDAFHKLPGLIASLSAALDIMAWNCRLSDILCNDSAPVFLYQLKNDLFRLHTTATRAVNNICASTPSTARVQLRVRLAQSIEQVLNDFGIIATITRGGSWDVCMQIVLSACGERVPSDCINYIRNAKKLNNIDQV
jgi:hypothetical protein